MAFTVQTLRRDQHDPTLSAKGLLGDFLDVSTGKRLGPLASSVEKEKVLEAFGAEKGTALWLALKEKGWLVPHNNDREGDMKRGEKYGWSYFDGPLKPFADDKTRQKLMGLLDERVVMVVFGDNASLSTSIAKAIGALLPLLESEPRAQRLIDDLDAFLNDQQPGYERLYHRKLGLFYFGWDAGKDRLMGWEDLQGQWQTGHMDYLINEFRDPATFVLARFGLPPEGLSNLGFKIKPYRFENGETIYVPAPWEGSAFQALGLVPIGLEKASPCWQRLRRDLVDVELDFARRHRLPGFLSESYSGRGAQYTGEVGIPAIAVNPKPRITDAASLYSLGIAYSIAPRKVEAFLADAWPVISTLLTDHGPWEGFNVKEQKRIEFQTTAHTLALLLGLLHTGPANMQRYVESRKLEDRVAALFAPCGPAEILKADTPVYAWADEPKAIRSRRTADGFMVSTDRVKRVGVAVVPSEAGVDLSGGLLTVRYRASQALGPLAIALKPVGFDPAAPLIAKEIFTRFEPTDGGQRELTFLLPANPGLKRIKEIVFSCEPPDGLAGVEFSLIGLTVAPCEDRKD